MGKSVLSYISKQLVLLFLSLSQMEFNIFVADLSRDVTSQQLLVCPPQQKPSYIPYRLACIGCPMCRSSSNSTTSQSDMQKVIMSVGYSFLCPLHSDLVTQ